MTSQPPRDFTSDDALCDVKIVVEGTSLFVHRQYLAEWSGVWRKLFLTECAENPTASIEIILEDKKLDEIMELLRCIYSTQKPVSDNNVQILLTLSEEYDMPAMKLRCEEYLLSQEMSIDNLILAERYNLKTLHKQCIEFAKTCTLEDLEQNLSYSEIGEQTLIKIYKEKVNMMRNYARDLKENERILIKQNEQLMDEKEGMVVLFKNIGQIWDMPNKRCFRHMTDKTFDYTCRDCNERIEREVRRMCNDGQHMRRIGKVNTQSTV